MVKGAGRIHTELAEIGKDNGKAPARTPGLILRTPTGVDALVKLILPRTNQKVTVLSVEISKTGKTVKWVIDSNGKEYTRKLGANRLVGMA